MVQAISMGEVARRRTVAHGTINGKKVVVEELLPWFGDFKGEPVIQIREDETKELVAYAGFRTGHGRAFREATPQWVELRQLSVMPRYRGIGIGSELLKLIVHVAKRSKVPLYLHPEATSDKPLKDDELRQFYARHGFRLFTPDEVEEITRRSQMHNIKTRLLFDGFQHGTRRITGPRIYSLSLEKIRKMDRYTDAELIALYRDHLKRQYRTDSAYHSNWSNEKERVGEHMPLAALNPNDEPLMFSVLPNYRLPNAVRVNATWRRIHASGKEPRIKPLAPRSRI